MKRQYQGSQNLSEEKKVRVDKELKLGFLNLSEGFFEQAKMNFELALQFDPNAPDGFWGLMLAKLGATNEDDLNEYPMKFKDAVNMQECQSAQENASEDLKKIYQSLLENVMKVSNGENY